MEISIDEEDSLTIKDFIDFLNKEENEPLRFLLRLELRQAYIRTEGGDNDDNA